MKRVIRFSSVLFPVVIASIVNLITLPLVYKSLDKFEAGIWFLLIDITSIALALDFGISNVQIRKMSLDISNLTDNSRTFYGSQKTLGYISIFIILAGSLAISAYYIISKSANIQIGVSSMFFLIATAITLYGYPLVGLLRINDMFPRIAFISLCSNLMYLILLFVLLHLNNKLISLSFIYFVRCLVNYIGFRISAVGIIKRFTNRGTIKYSREHAIVFMNTFSLYLYLAIESLVLSVFYTPTIIAMYIAHRKLFDFTKSGIDAYLNSAFPSMSRRFAHKDYKKLVFFMIGISIIYLTLFILCVPVMHYIAGSKYILQRNLLAMITLQFIISGGSIYIRQKNVTSNLASIALASAIAEISIKLLLSVILIPILSFKAIPLSSIIGAVVSILIGLSSSNKRLS
ncbi:hypothetical protein [Deinococcus altitudinis]|uniref:hypothetical protein n=1 Tax=Deinococcus altitudinis TaxID=468914 RepID=UPI003891E43A